ncbi:MAG: hypothetical protein N2578_03665 [Bdellovibrionaceae bacterium]|nr:hypothetical protein [Pseudobdellovibrionaceae bacterium]
MKLSWALLALRINSESARNRVIEVFNFETAGLGFGFSGNKGKW